MKEVNEYLAEFLFYCCPECNDRNSSRETFLNHAFEKHPEATDNLKRLRDKVQTIEEELGNHDENVNEEPWSVVQLESYLFFCCPEPECGEIDQDEASFIKHAFGSHPYANELHNKFLEMMRIKDDDDDWIPFQARPNRKPGRPKGSKIKEQPQNEVKLPLPPNMQDLEGFAIKQEIVDEEYYETNGNYDESFSEADFAFKQEFYEGDASQSLDFVKQEGGGYEDYENFDYSFDVNDVNLDQDQEAGEDEDYVPDTKDEIQFKCESCQDKFSDFMELINHMRDVHNKVDDIKIEDAKITPKKSPRKPKEILPCDFCGKEFKLKGKLRKHIQEVHDGIGLEPEPTSFDCPTCGKSFEGEQLMKNHIKRIHENTEEFHCNICQKVFDDSYKLKKHIKLVHQKVKNWQCDACAKAFGTSSDLKRHVRNVHEKIKRYKCELCEDAFADRTSLKTHERNKHEKFETFDFKCDKCNKVFKTEEGVKIHLKLVHDGKKNEENMYNKVGTFDGQFHRCDLCNKEFSHQASLSMHVQLVHEKRKDHKCHLCEKAFARPERLKRHIDFRHYGIKHFQCDKCERSFPHPEHLTYHIKSVHEVKRDSVCEICGKGFVTPQNMLKHVQNVHEKRRDYQCHICGKYFSTPQIVKSHIKKIHDSGLDLIQASKQTFKCELCSSGFTQIGSYNKHMKTYHSDPNSAKSKKMMARYKNSPSIPKEELV